MSGGPTPPPRPVCAASGALSAAHLEALARLLPARALREVLAAGPELRCALERHAGPHLDVVHDPASGDTLWARWSDANGPDAEPDAVLPLPDCPATTGPIACAHPLGHPGGHSRNLTAPAPAGSSMPT
ncbi:hypothetical protein AB0D46_29450 [Streptomyces sp. NPDC048383]|uniref:hypothetical protein n=1 Tax=Streptomyces sp. NPDC048383 TaxID=3155386 RepID=UPI003412E1C4